MKLLCLPIFSFLLFAVEARGTETDTAGESVAQPEATAEGEAAAPGVTEASTEVEAAPIEEPEPEPALADLDPAWAVYEEAFRAAVRNDLEEAEALLHQLINTFPDHPAASSARSVLDTVAQNATRRASAATPVTDQLHVEEKTNLARAEIAIFQTGHGLGLGIEFCLVVGCGEPEIWVVALVAFAGGGIAGSMVATMDGVTPGTALAINSGTTWGFWNGLAVLFITTPTEGAWEKKWGGVLMGAQLLGLGGGIAASLLVRPTAGAISMANSGGIWSGVMTLWAFGIFADELDGDTFWGTLLAASDLGLLAGAIASRQFPMTRGRTLVIDAGGILGMLVGVAAIVLVGVDDIDRKGAFGIMAAATVGGLTLTTFLTREWDVPDAPVHAALVPVGDPVHGVTGAQAVVGFNF